PLLLLALALLPFSLNAQQTITVSGLVEESDGGEAIVNAIIRAGKNKTAITNTYGHFTLTLPKGYHQLITQHVGFYPDTLRLLLTADTTIRCRLTPSTLLEEIIIRPVRQPVAGKHVLAMEQIKTAPALLGEPDILKTIQQLPGVNGGTEGTSAFSIRGGNPEQTLVLLDGMPVYNINHAFGYISAFNARALKDVTLYKSDIPARHGGRLGSVMEVTMKEGNRHALSGDLSLGLLAGSATLEGPIIKEKASFILSARRTWLDAPARLAQNIAASTFKVGYGFHDLNGKANWQLDNRHHLFLSFYNGRDRFSARWKSDGMPGGYTFRWGNFSLAGRWNVAATPRLFINTTLFYSRFNYSNEARQRREEGGDDIARAFSTLDEVTLKSDVDLAGREGGRTRFGASLTRRHFAPEMSRLSVGSSAASWSDATSGATWEAALHAATERQIGRRWHVNAGIRTTAIVAVRARYASLEPRLSLAYRLAPVATLKGSFALTSQPLHLLANSSLEWKTDMWVPVSERIKPGRAHLYSLGFQRDSLPGGLGLTVEIYHSRMARVARYDDGVQYLKRKDQSWQEYARVGQGRASGLEIMVEKPSGRLNGWVAYTLASAERRFPGVAVDAWFPFEYDRRHKLNVVAGYTLSREGRGRWRRVLSANFTLASGNRVTIGEEAYLAAPLPGGEASWSYLFWENREYLPSPNNARLPLYHHLDVAMHFQNRRARGSSWSFGAYNVYGRQNPGFFYRVVEGERFVYKQVSIMPFVPFVSWNYKF
ncbi:MAG: TonB-dependent receptor plug domain-containing protein, partial [Odoribacteraceae bacterium]|nr:TonB-dependent receptor plug domain-containing protein [Odoribacteraceae bacterium]